MGSLRGFEGNIKDENGNIIGYGPISFEEGISQIVLPDLAQNLTFIGVQKLGVQLGLTPQQANLAALPLSISIGGAARGNDASAIGQAVSSGLASGVTSLVISQAVGDDSDNPMGDAALGRLISGMIGGLVPQYDPITGEPIDRDGDGRADKEGLWEGLKGAVKDVATAPLSIGRTGDFVRDQAELIEFGQTAKEVGFDQALEQYATSILNRQTTEAIVRSAGSVTEWMKQKRQNNEVEVIDFNGTQAKFLELNEDGDYLIFNDEQEKVDFYARRLGDYYEEGEFAVDGSGQFILESGTRSKTNDDGSYYTDWVQDGASWMRQQYRADGESVLMAVDPYKQKPLTSEEVFEQGFFNGVVADEAGRILEFYENGKLTERRTRVETLDIEQTADGSYRIRRDDNAGYLSQQFDAQGNEVKQELGIGKDLLGQYRLAQEEQNQRLRDILSPPNDPSNDFGLEGETVPGKDFWPEVQRLGGILPPGSRIKEDGTLEWPTGPVMNPGGNIPIGTMMILPGPAGVGGVIGGTATFAWYSAPTAQGTKVASGGQVRLDDEDSGNDQPPGFWDRVKNWWGNLGKKQTASNEILFAQKSISETFGKGGPFGGKTIDEVANGLRDGSIKPEQLPIQVIKREGKTYTLNNRSLMALRKAGLEPTVVKDVTGIPDFERTLSNRLIEIKWEITPDFVPIIRGREQ